MIRDAGQELWDDFVAANKSRVDAVLDTIESALKKAEGKQASVADYIRLLQYQRETKAETPREIKVRWIDADQREYIYTEE